MSKWIKVIIPGMLFLVAMQTFASSAEKANVESLKQDLRAVRANQEQILMALAEIKEELRIVKIRVTR